MGMTVTVLTLKKFASERLRNFPLTRDLLTSESDHLPVEEFAIKCRLWLQVLRRERELSALK